MIKAQPRTPIYACPKVYDEFRSDEIGYCGSFGIHTYRAMDIVNKTANLNHQLPDIDLERAKSSECDLNDYSSMVPTATSSNVDLKSMSMVKFSKKESLAYEAMWITDTAVVIKKSVEEVPGFLELNDNIPLELLVRTLTEKSVYERKYSLTTVSYYMNLSTIVDFDELWT